MAAEPKTSTTGVDLTVDGITDAVNHINSANPDPRFRYILERLVVHLHDFARETRLSTKEWMSALRFLESVGETCTPLRDEFVLLSDVLGLSLLVDSIDHPKPESATEGTLLGPFHTHDAENVAHGTSISRDVEGEPLLVICTVKDTDGKPLQGVTVDIWETDSTGHYDTQYANRDGPDGRAILETDVEGVFWFKAIVPVPYPIPGDGPVGRLLELLGRHNMRPGHMHFKLDKEGYEHLITALYVRGDPYERSDAVFGVKSSLIIDLEQVDEELATQYQVSSGSRLLRYDFVLVTEQESAALRQRNSNLALERLGRSLQLIDGLPVAIETKSEDKVGRQSV
ncbi:Intradiol ring-cleavage dioxygenase [Ilyonectria destructans]|nr:Intradiol ring-cleavage dioxygenase [Ilyonectria destructans]